MQTANPVSGKASSPTKGGLICLYMQPLLALQTTKFVICISVYIHAPQSHITPPPRSLVPRIGYGNTWVRQLRAGSCHYPTAFEETGDVLNYDVSEDEDMSENMESNSDTCEKTFPNREPNESHALELEAVEVS